MLNPPFLIRGLIIDMDGVLWRVNDPIGDLPGIFTQIRRLGLKLVLATNNGTRTPQQYIEKLVSFGVQLDLDEVVNSSVAAAGYLKKRFPQGGPVCIVGEEGLRLALDAAGFRETSEPPLAVVAGMDRTISYQKLARASAFVRQGALLLATNTDATFPTPQGLMPGAGTIIAALETACQQQAVVAGKPSPALYQTCMERMGTSPSETLVIGDRLETDIKGGQDLGCPTALVLTGVTTPEQAALWSPSPDWIEADLTAVIKRLERESNSDRA